MWIGCVINSKVILKLGKIWFICVINSKVILKKIGLRYKFKSYIEKIRTAL